MAAMENSENAVGRVIAEVYGLLSPLSAPERAAVLAAVRAAFGVESTTRGPVEGRRDPPVVAEQARSAAPFGQHAMAFIRRAGLSQDDLEEVFVFHGDSEVEVNVGRLPGNTAKEQTHAGYLLVGAASFLATDGAEISEKQVTDFLKLHGAYNQANHAAYRKSLGNLVTGTKRSGFKLTTPGLRRAGEVIRELITLAKA